MVKIVFPGLFCTAKESEKENAHSRTRASVRESERMREEME